METTFGAQQIWIQKLLLYTTLFHMFILWIYAGYNIYTYFKATMDLHGSCLIYSVITFWVSIMFSWFMIQGISGPNRYYLRYAILSITIMTLYIFWWYLYPLFDLIIDQVNDPFIETILYINVVLCLEYYVIYMCYSSNQNTVPTLSKKTRKRNKRNRKRSSVPIYKRCIPILLFDNEICTMYFASCIFQYFDDDPIKWSIFCIICVCVQWIIVYAGYIVMNQKDPKCSLCLLISYCILFIVGFWPSVLYLMVQSDTIALTQYKSWIMIMFGQFILLPFLVFITKISAIYWIYQSYKHFNHRRQQKQDKNADIPQNIDTKHQCNASDSSNAHKHYVPPIQTIKQLSGFETSCKDSPNHCNSRDHNISDLIHLCSDFGKDNTTYNKLLQAASSTMSNTLNQLYDNEEGILSEQSTKSSNTSRGEMMLHQFWEHYMEFHPNIGRYKDCPLSHKCVWSKYMKKHNDNNKDSTHRLLAFCVNRKQLFHVYFYHSVDYDLISRDEKRKERYIENSENLQEIKDSEMTIHRAYSRAMTDYTDEESDHPDLAEPGTPFNDGYLNMDSNKSLNIEMTTMNENECIAKECSIIREILEYGSTANCTLSDGPDPPNGEEEKLIQLYLHCITHHSSYKVRCHDIHLCGFKLWNNNEQQSMRQMIHSEFYQHNDANLEIVVEKEIVISVKELEEEEEECKYDECLHEDGLLKPILYLPTRVEILKSKSKTKSQIQNVNILQFGHPFTAKSAKFNNAKCEILQNEYKTLTAREWNDLLKKCVGLSKTLKAKAIKLSLKQLVALKLYTDFDDLQRELRKCYRGSTTDQQRQRQFYHWHSLLESACIQSNDIITSRLYHGVNQPLTLSSFSGTYYGPISTTTIFDIAKQFAGSNGRILELYPSFSKRGLRVSWLSNFPDEDEVLYMNASFQITNIYTNQQCTNLYRSPFDDPIPNFPYYSEDEESLSTISSRNDESKNEVNSLDDEDDDEDEEKKIEPMHIEISSESVNDNNTLFFERTIMKAIQMINTDSYIISFNSTEFDSDYVDYMMDLYHAGFGKLAPDEQIAVLYLLYLQYKKNEWTDFLTSTPDHVNMAIARYRDQFITLANNVEAVKMERASKLVQQFFARVHETHYEFPPKFIKMEDKSDVARVFKMLMNIDDKEEKYILNLSTFCKLFPNCKQVKINGDNFDWSLDAMIDFLSKYNLNYSRIALQDIYIRFGDNYDDIDYSERKAMNRIRETSDSKLDKLLKLGWQFVNGTRCHLHRYGFKPHPELPFLSLFANINISRYEDGVRGKKPHINKWAIKDIVNMSYSSESAKKIALIRKSMTNKSNKSNKSKSKSLFNESTLKTRNISNKSLFNESKTSPPPSSVYSSDLNHEGVQPSNLRLAYSRTSSYNTITSSKNVEGRFITIVPYNPSVCDLSCNVFYKHSIEHQTEITQLLQFVKSGKLYENENHRHKTFGNLCRKIQRLVLDPMPIELKQIFIEKSNTTQKREIISFESIIKIFPNLQDVFLRDTRFSLRIWYNLLKSIKKYKNNNNNNDEPGHCDSFCKLSRIFFSKEYFINEKDLKTMNLRFKPHAWKFEPIEQVIFTKLN